MKRVLFVDHVDRILGGAEINLLELLSVREVSQRWNVGCACAPTGSLREALAKIPEVRLFRYGAASGFNQVRLVDRQGALGRFWKGWRATAAAARELGGIQSTFNPDVVVTCTNKDHFAAALCSATPSPRRVWWVNDLLTTDFFSWPARRVFSLIASRTADRLVAVSNAVALALTAAGVPSCKVRTIQNGIPVELYAKKGTGRLRSQLGCGQKPLIGILGRFTPWMGQHLALEIARHSVACGLEAHFLFVGRAFNEDQAYERTLHAFVAQHNLSSQVTFLPFQSDMPSVLADLDIVMHTSIKPEPFGRVIIEAMAAGAVVIAAAAGGVTEILESGVSGIAVRCGDVAAYLRAIQSVLDDRAFREKLVAAARATVVTHFTVERVFEQFDQLVSEPAT